MWAALPPFPAQPARDPRPITLVTAAIDSSAFFHDLAQVRSLQQGPPLSLDIMMATVPQTLPRVPEQHTLLQHEAQTPTWRRLIKRRINAPCWSKMLWKRPNALRAQRRTL